MNKQRLSKLIGDVHQRYASQNITPSVVAKLYRDVSVVIEGLHKTEHFLNVTIDVDKKTILCKDEETITYLGLLPYLDTRLMEDESLYLVYLMKNKQTRLECAVEFKDLYKDYRKNNLGFDLEIHSTKSLGVYYPNTNTFKRR